MYAIAIKRTFIARHRLAGTKHPQDSRAHSHQYRLEVILEGNRLNEHGFLVDIEDLDRLVEARVRHFQDTVLNDLPEFAALNPTLEHFARILWYSLSEHLSQLPQLTMLTVRIWKGATTWAVYRRRL